jgi:hypothetical protein
MKKETQKDTYAYATVKYHKPQGTRKWEFTARKYTLILSLRGGEKAANKVARILAASVKRTKGKDMPIDGLARKAIADMLIPATKE